MILEKWLTQRTDYYVLWTAIFLIVYGGATTFLEVPATVWLSIVVISLLKDIYDEIRIYRGGTPLAYADIEHNPSNILILVFIAVGIINPDGSTLRISNTVLIVAMSLIDLVIDGWQDLRH